MEYNIKIMLNILIINELKLYKCYNNGLLYLNYEY